MKFTKFILLLSACLSLISCNAEPSSDSTATPASANKVAAHLAALDYDYSKMLTKEDVLAAIEISDPSRLETKLDDHKDVGSPEYGECVYEWPSDRPAVKINPQFPAQADDNRIRISNLSFEDGELKTIRKRFDKAYRPLTAEQIDAMTKRLEESFKDKPAEELETAKGFIAARAKSTYQAVEGIGDAAYWRPTKVMDLYLGSELVVLTGNAKFTITAKVSNDDDKNLEMAKKMAVAILAKGK